MNEQDRTILIEQYLDNELSDNETCNFEIQIEIDKKLAEDYKLQQIIRKAIQEKEVHKLRDKLNEFKLSSKKKSEKKKLILITSFSSIVIISVIASLLFFNQTQTSDELYARYYEHYEVTRTMSKADNLQEIFDQALSFYDKTEYSQAIELFNQINETSEYYVSKEYFLALSYMETQNFNKAIKHFKTTINDEQSIFNENAIWYTGLCYLKINQVDKAILQFNKLADSSYKDKIEILLKELK